MLEDNNDYDDDNSIMIMMMMSPSFSALAPLVSQYEEHLGM